MTANPQLAEIFRHVILPGLAGAAGTGAASAYLSQRNHDPNESKGDRRRRILRNALYGSALGGVAGGALPTGLSMLGAPFFDSGAGKSMPLTSQALDKTTAFGLQHALPAATAAAGGYGIYRGEKANKHEALQRLAQVVRGEPRTANDPKDLIQNANRLRPMLNTPEGTRRVMGLWRDRNPGAHNVFKANEAIQATGESPGMTMSDVAEHFGGDLHGNPTEGAYKLLTPKSEILKHYRQYLGSQGPISKLMSYASQENIPALQGLRTGVLKSLVEKSPLANRALSGLENIDPSGLAEAYGRWFRPSISSLSGGVPAVAKLGLLGGGMMLANHLQQKAMGQ